MSDEGQKRAGARGRPEISKGPRKERVSLERLRECDPMELDVLRQLQEAGLQSAILNSLRFGKRLVTPHHLALISDAKCVIYKFVEPPLDPPEKFMRRSTSLVAAAQIAYHYVCLDQRWETHPRGTVEANALLDAWGIYVASRSGDLGTDVMSKTVERLKDEGVDLRVAWQIITSVTNLAVKVSLCESCRRPRLTTHEDNRDTESKWASLPATCPSCAAISELRRQRRDDNSDDKNGARRKKVVEGPIYGPVGEHEGVAEGGNVNECEPPPAQTKLSVVA